MAKTQCIAYDDDGSIMEYHTLFTICPIVYLDQARDLALFYLNHMESGGGSDPERMLPTPLYDLQTGEITHYCCHRSGYDNTVRDQWAIMTAAHLNGDTWVSDTTYYIDDKPDAQEIRSKFSLVIGPKNKVARHLGMRL